jgi:hypothetical protein
VNEEVVTARETEHEILAATANGVHTFADQGACDGIRRKRRREPRVCDGDLRERPPGQDRLQAPPDRLDLGQLRHEASLALAR